MVIALAVPELDVVRIDVLPYGLGGAEVEGGMLFERHNLPGGHEGGVAGGEGGCVHLQQVVADGMVRGVAG